MTESNVPWDYNPDRETSGFLKFDEILFDNQFFQQVTNSIFSSSLFCAQNILKFIEVAIFDQHSKRRDAAYRFLLLDNLLLKKATASIPELHDIIVHVLDSNNINAISRLSEICVNVVSQHPLDSFDKFIERIDISSVAFSFLKIFGDQNKFYEHLTHFATIRLSMKLLELAERTEYAWKLLSIYPGEDKTMPDFLMRLQEYLTMSNLGAWKVVSSLVDENNWTYFQQFETQMAAQLSKIEHFTEFEETQVLILTKVIHQIDLTLFAPLIVKNFARFPNHSIALQTMSRFLLDAFKINHEFLTTLFASDLRSYMQSTSVTLRATANQLYRAISPYIVSPQKKQIENERKVERIVSSPPNLSLVSHMNGCLITPF